MIDGNTAALEAMQAEQEKQETALASIIENQRFIHKLDELRILVEEIHDEFDTKDEYDFSEEIQEALQESIV